MIYFESTEFQLLRLAARFRPLPETKRRGVKTSEVASIINQLMNDGFYAEEFSILNDPNLNYFEMLPILKQFLTRLNWQPLTDEGEFRFMTAIYAKVGQRDDVSAYYAIRRWMDEVGLELDRSETKKYVADQIGAEIIYACYYSFSQVTGGDLIPSVSDPIKHDWSSEGEARPMKIFADWLVQNPKDHTEYTPIEIGLLEQLRAQVHHLAV